MPTSYLSELDLGDGVSRKLKDTNAVSTVASQGLSSEQKANARANIDVVDFNVTSPSNGQVLKYNSTTQKWENGTGGSGTDLDSLNTSTNDSADDDVFVTKENGGNAWVKKSMSKLWNYIWTKLGVYIGSTADWIIKTDAQKAEYRFLLFTDDEEIILNEEE